MQRPGPGAQLNEAGPPSVPRPSASIIVARDGDGAIEVLLVQRNPRARHMGGFWVFPGGVVDPDEDHRAAAVRELAEEAGITGVAPADLVQYSRWITPELIASRFDTRFFCVRAPAGVHGTPDGSECVDLRWMTPRAALDAYAAGELQIVFPTMRHLEQLAAVRDVDELLGAAREQPIAPVLPRIVMSGGQPRVVLPGESGYDL